jgi:hypothetical protein
MQPATGFLYPGMLVYLVAREEVTLGDRLHIYGPVEIYLSLSRVLMTCPMICAIGA